MINTYMDLQSLANYASIAMGKEKAQSFMTQRNPDLQNQIPMNFYTENPSRDNYKKIIDAIHKWCSQFN